MEITESILKSQYNYDHKNITNKGGGIVSPELVSQIETGGITSEILDTFPFPIFKYQTQITLHGVFNSEKDYFRSGGYKNLIINKNKSLGVRYSAIDIKKKQLIKHILCLEKSRFTLSMNSSECEILSYLPLSETNIETMKQVFKILPTNYIGGSQLYVSKSQWGSYIVISIALNAIYEREIYPFLSQLLQKEYNEAIQSENEAIIEAERIERNKEYEAKRQIEHAEQQKAFETAKTEFLSKYQIKYIHTFAVGRYLYFSTDCSNQFAVKIFHLFQNKNKMYMFYKETVSDLAKIPVTNPTDHNRKQLKEFRLKQFNQNLTKDFYFKLS